MRKMMISTLLFGLAGVTFAQQPKIDADQSYLLIAANKTATIQQEIDDAAAQGFRVLAGSPTSGTEMVLFLERVAQPPDTYKYRLIATTKTSTFEKELATAAQEGFRLLPGTIVAKDPPAARFVRLPQEIVAVLELGPRGGKKYEYKLLATHKTATLQKEVSEAVKAGFALVGMVSRDEHMVILEKEAR